MSHNIICILVAISLFCIICTNGSFTSMRRSLWNCKPCIYEEECNEEPEEPCINGETRDVCNRRVCAKGPGEKCGGPNHYFGECGENLMCKDGRCYGCNIITEVCYPHYS